METPLTTTTTTQQQQHKMFRLFKEIWNPIDLKKEFVFYEYENDDVAIKKVKQTFKMAHIYIDYNNLSPLFQHTPQFHLKNEKYHIAENMIKHFINDKTINGGIRNQAEYLCDEKTNVCVCNDYADELRKELFVKKHKKKYENDDEKTIVCWMKNQGEEISLEVLPKPKIMHFNKA